MDSILHATFTTCNHDVYPQDVYMPDNHVMVSDYERLLKAASELKGWDSPSEVATGLTRAGYEVTPQKMTNWKSRGVSQEGLMNTSRIIGCRPHWMESGDGPMLDKRTPDFANTEPGPALEQKPPTIPDDIWQALPPKARALVEDIIQKSHEGKIREDDLVLLISTTDRLSKHDP